MPSRKAVILNKKKTPEKWLFRGLGETENPEFQDYAFFNAAWAAARRATGTRGGEQLT
jgi:hypothetical protein